MGLHGVAILGACAVVASGCGGDSVSISSGGASGRVPGGAEVGISAGTGAAGAHQCEFAPCGGDPTGSWMGEWLCPENGFTVVGRWEGESAEELMQMISAHRAGNRSDLGF
jgi:hypothetical protein